MTVEEAVRAQLLTIAALAALVSTRIHLDKLPQSPTYPCVLVTLVDEQMTYHLRGGNDLKWAAVQVDAYAREVSGVDPYALAVTVAEAIHGDDAGSGLSGFSGAIGSPAFRIAGMFRRERQRAYDPDELRVLRISQDYKVDFYST